MCHCFLVLFTGAIKFCCPELLSIASTERQRQTSDIFTHAEPDLVRNAQGVTFLMHFLVAAKLRIQVLSHFPEAGVRKLPEEGQGLLWDVLLTFPVQHVTQLLWLKSVVSHTPQHDCHSVEHFCDVVLSHTIYCQFFFF